MAASEADFILYSDGGGERMSTAAGACILDDAGSGSRERFVTFLGPGTNNEAEICGALTGFSALWVKREQRVEAARIRWVCDSEYVLKSATEYIRNWVRNGWKTADKKPVKNQGLWRAYLLLSGGLEIRPEHVRGHTDHPENEACDSASTWARMEGGRYLAEHGNGSVVTLDGDDWKVLDGRPYLDALRSDEADERSCTLLAAVLAGKPLDVAPAPRRERKSAHAVTGSPVRQALDELRSSLKRLEESANGDETAERLSGELARLIMRFDRA